LISGTRRVAGAALGLSLSPDVAGRLGMLPSVGHVPVATNKDMSRH